MFGNAQTQPGQIFVPHNGTKLIRNSAEVTSHTLGREGDHQVLHIGVYGADDRKGSILRSLNEKHLKNKDYSRVNLTLINELYSQGLIPKELKNEIYKEAEYIIKNQNPRFIHFTRDELVNLLVKKSNNGYNLDMRKVMRVINQYYNIKNYSTIEPFDLSNVMQTAKEFDATTVWGHPRNTARFDRDNSRFEYALDSLVDQGLSGVETHYGVRGTYYNPSMDPTLMRRVDEKGLVTSAGSDFHNNQVKSGLRKKIGSTVNRSDNRVGFSPEQFTLVDQLKQTEKNRGLGGKQ